MAAAPQSPSGSDADLEQQARWARVQALDRALGDDETAASAEGGPASTDGIERRREPKIRSRGNNEARKTE